MTPPLGRCVGGGRGVERPSYVLPSLLGNVLLKKIMSSSCLFRIYCTCNTGDIDNVSLGKNKVGQGLLGEDERRPGDECLTRLKALLSQLELPYKFFQGG